MRSVQSILVIILLALPIAIHASAFTDTAGSAAKASIEELWKRGIVQGFKDGTFRPESEINRAEFLTILTNALVPTSLQPKDLRCFKDLEVKIPQWYARSVCIGRELGIVNGYSDGTFRPEHSVNLAEALKMSFHSFGILPTHASEVWYEPYLRLARDRMLLIPLIKNPGRAITRGDMATIVHTLLKERESAVEQVDLHSVCGNGTKENTEQCDDGNVKDSDGCSSICISVSEPTRMSLLQIDMEANGTVSNIARGQTHIPLLRFSAVANRQDATITSLTFVPTIGSLLYATHYTLSMDRNGDGLYEDVVQSVGRTEQGRLVFDHLGSSGVRIPKNLRVPFQVTADLVSTLGPVGLQLEFGTTIPGFVEAQGTDDGLSLPGIETNGICTAPNCFIRVNTLAATEVNVVSRGSLFVTEASTPTRSHILLGGSTSDVLLLIDLRAEGEAIDLKKIAFDGVPSGIDSLLLTNPLSTIPFAQASNGQCTSQSPTRMCAVLPYSTFVVQPNKTFRIAVRAVLKNDQGGAVSGQIASLVLSSATDDSHSIEARGVSSLADLEQNNGDGVLNGEIIIGRGTATTNSPITARQSDVALAAISSVARSGPAEEVLVPTGTAVIGRFTIAASPHTNTYGGSNNVVIKALTFHVTAQNVQLDPLGYRLSDDGNPSLTLPCSATETTGSFDVTCLAIDSGVIRSHIDQGSSATFRLSGNVTNASFGSGPSFLSVSLATMGDRATTNSVVWSDEVTTFSWVDIPETSILGTMYR